jgi:release factor glutamine methyltransferase
MEKLTTAGVDSPRLDAQLLLAWAMDVSREELAKAPERVIDERAGLIFWKSIALRCERRPLPYITGEAWFYGRAFKVNRAVLIPRPETETIVDFAKSLAPKDKPIRIADIGTGSGCIAVSIALELPHARVVAVDISRLALLVAAKNVRRYALADRVKLLEGDLLSPFDTGDKFDLIVSNPPYVPISDRESLMPEVRDYEPEMALFGDNAVVGTPTSLRERLLHDTKSQLCDSGWIAIEIGTGQADEAHAQAQNVGYRNVDVRPDMAGIGRLLTAQWRG